MDERTRILDIGGQLDPGSRHLLDSHEHKHNITVLNLDPQHLERIREMPIAGVCSGSGSTISTNASVRSNSRGRVSPRSTSGFIDKDFFERYV
jgi:hypothetical protein